MLTPEDFANDLLDDPRLARVMKMVAERDAELVEFTERQMNDIYAIQRDFDQRLANEDEYRRAHS